MKNSRIILLVIGLISLPILLYSFFTSDNPDYLTTLIGVICSACLIFGYFNGFNSDLTNTK